VRTVVVRIWLPDRPGALGQVASRIGAVRGDVLGIEVLESGAGSVIDELVVLLPDVGLVDLMVSEIDAVDGVSVEYVRVIEGDHIDPDLAALGILADVAGVDREDRAVTLGERVAALVGSEWLVLVRDGRAVARVGEQVDDAVLEPYRLGPGHILAPHPPTELFWSAPGSGWVLIAQRVERPIHTRERDRVDAIMRVAVSLLG